MMIIFEALDFTQKILNAFLKKTKSGDEKAVLSSLVDPNGAVPPGAFNKVVITLLNVEREGAASPANFITSTGNGQTTQKTFPQLSLNLYVLIAGNHNDYKEALRMLSKAVGFFQAYPVFTPESVPSFTTATTPTPFPTGLQRLAFEVYNMRLQEMSHLWGALGAKYQPSIIYKVRMLTLQSAWTIEERPAITGSETQVQR